MVFVVKLFSITTAEEITSNTKNTNVKALLEEFKIAFKEPMHLPLIRKLDHRIPLVHGAKPTNITDLMGVPLFSQKRMKSW